MEAVDASTLATEGERRNDSDGIKARLRSGTVWNLLAAISTQGATFVVSLLVGRILGTEGFGRYSAVTNTLLTIASVSQLAAGSTATKYLAEFRQSAGARAFRIYVLLRLTCGVNAFLGAAGVFLGAEALSQWLLGTAELAMLFRVGAVFVLFASLNALQTGVLAGFEAYRDLGLAGTLGGMFAVLASGIGCVYWGTVGAVLGFVATALVRFVVHTVRVTRNLAQCRVPVSWREALGEHRVIVDFSVPAAISGLVLMPVVWLANAMLVKQPGGVTEFAVYSAAFTLRAVVLFLPGVVSNVALSLLNNLRGAGAAEGFRDVFRRSLWLVAGVGLVVALGLQLMGGWVLGWFGRDFSAGKSVLSVLLISGWLEAVALAAYQRVQVSGRMWVSLGLVIIPWQAVFLAVAWWLVPFHGALGLAAATACGSGTFLLATIICIRWFTR